jgi:hypothetical protein
MMCIAHDMIADLAPLAQTPQLDGSESYCLDIQMKRRKVYALRAQFRAREDKGTVAAVDLIVSTSMRPRQEGKSTKQERRPSLAVTGAFDPCDHEQARGRAATPDRGRRPKRYWRVWRADGESKKAGTITGVFVLYVHSGGF